jgi:hypothetical protein
LNGSQQFNPELGPKDSKMAKETAQFRMFRRFCRRKQQIDSQGSGA